MIVISDTTPVISLIKMRKLELLKDLFGEVQIPEAVYRELTSNKMFEDEAEQVLSCDFIKCVALSDIHSVDLLRRSTNLDAGESEAIILADSISDSILLVDEEKGRKVAKNMGLNIMGTIGVLLAAYEENFLDSNDIDDCINHIRNSQLRISEKLIDLLYKRTHSF
ncbi:MAG: DUF3368 domain-containing protein [Lachnospiraceae bacterium]